MSGFFSFIGGVIEFLLFVGIVLAGIAFWGYNTLRSLSENVHECKSNVGVVAKKQASLINQLQDVVKGYEASEKLVMLKVSEDVSSVGQLAQLHQQSSMLLSTAGGMAQKFPELKANHQFQRLIDSMQTCEAQLETARQKYNVSVKAYNIARSSIPHVFYASTLGFSIATYFEVNDETGTLEVGAIKSFSSDDDGERLNALLGQAGSKILEVGNKAFESSRLIANAAQDKIVQITQTKTVPEELSASDVNDGSCLACAQAVSLGNAFCGGCGKKV